MGFFDRFKGKEKETEITPPKCADCKSCGKPEMGVASLNDGTDDLYCAECALRIADAARSAADEQDPPRTKRTLEELYAEALDCPTPYLLKDIEYPSEYPTFRFFPNPLRTPSVIESSVPCECCGRIDKYSYVAGIEYYSEGEEPPEVNNLCLFCISNGEAIKKFGGEFTHRGFIANRTADKAITEEIMYRTPSFMTWQEKEWLSHCKLPCIYIGQVYTADLFKLGIYKQVRTDLSKTFYYKQMPMTVAEIDDMLIGLGEGSCLEGHLFKCTVCGKYRLSLDLD
jgi:uncharacterized protein CbrC (UPF0167 family)